MTFMHPKKTHWGHDAQATPYHPPLPLVANGTRRKQQTSCSRPGSLISCRTTCQTQCPHSTRWY